MATPFLEQLVALTVLQAVLGAKISRDRINVHVDNLTSEELNELVTYLLANGGEWRSDERSYSDDYPDTYHLWLTNRSINLCCGFVYRGITSDSKTGEQRPFNYALCRFIQRG